MTVQPSGCHEAGQLRNPAKVSSDELEARLVWLCSEVRLKVNNLRAAVPYPSMKNAIMVELPFYKKTTKDLVVFMIRELENAMDVYADKKMDRSEVDKVYRMGGGVIWEAYDWFEELDEGKGRLWTLLQRRTLDVSRSSSSRLRHWRTL